MKINKYVEDLKAKSAAELNEELVAAKKELFNLRFQNATNQLENTFGIGTVDITQQCSSAAWLGQTSGEDFADTDGSKERVYITAQGTVYHKSRQCTYLNPSIRQITQEQLDTARNSSGAKYYLCERCGKRSGSGIYITDYGEKYHYDKNCSGLKRSIFSVPLSEVQDKGACSKCAEYNSG